MVEAQPFQCELALDPMGALKSPTDRRQTRSRSWSPSNMSRLSKRTRLAKGEHAMHLALRLKPASTRWQRSSSKYILDDFGCILGLYWYIYIIYVCMIMYVYSDGIWVYCSSFHQDQLFQYILIHSNRKYHMQAANPSLAYLASYWDHLLY